MLRKNLVLVYKDDGCMKDSPIAIFNWLKAFLNQQDIAVAYVSANDIFGINPYGILGNKGLIPSNILALCIPGGQSRTRSDINRLRACNNAGLKLIYNFVERGGFLLGICGGGYLPARITDFRGDPTIDPFEIRRTSEFFLFDGIAQGSIPELTNGHFYNGKDRSSANVVEISYNGNKSAFLYYKGGPCFITESETGYPANVEILSRYAITGKPAVIKISHGKGTAVLSGVHPEYYTGQGIPLLPNSVDYAHCHTMRNTLEKHISDSEAFSMFILSQLGLKPVAATSNF